MKVFYLAHDLNDSAIRRRVEQLKRGGAEVRVAGFRRSRNVASASHYPEACIVFGQTSDGHFGRRICSVISASFRLRHWSRHALDCDVILARSLEMLVLGTILQATYCRDKAVVYECLDVHRLMVGANAAGRLLRLVERCLMRRCSMLITSSPAFVQHYFNTYQRMSPPVLLWENRLLTDEVRRNSRQTPVTSLEPWKIGWFGIIRCERSLQILEKLCLALPGLIEIHIRGRPSEVLAPQIKAAVASTPGLMFGGSYDRAQDLHHLYGAVHFAWAIDYFEEGANSDWLLPNRLYEGAGHGAIPLALECVETGQWLRRRAFGVLLGADLLGELVEFFRTLDLDRYRVLQERMNAVEVSAFVQPDEELVSIVHRLASLTSQPAPAKAALS